LTTTVGVIDDCLTTQQMGEFWYKFRGGATYILKSVVSEFGDDIPWNGPRSSVTVPGSGWGEEKTGKNEWRWAPPQAINLWAVVALPAARNGWKTGENLAGRRWSLCENTFLWTGMRRIQTRNCVKNDGLGTVSNVENDSTGGSRAIFTWATLEFDTFFTCSDVILGQSCISRGTVCGVEKSGCHF